MADCDNNNESFKDNPAIQKNLPCDSVSKQSKRCRMRPLSNVTTTFPRNTRLLSFTVWVPKHVSALSLFHHHDDDISSIRSASKEQKSSSLFLFCHRPGVLWHGLVPMILDHPTGYNYKQQQQQQSNLSPAQKILSIIWETSWQHQSTSLLQDVLMNGSGIQLQPESMSTSVDSNVNNSSEDSESTLDTMMHPPIVVTLTLPNATTYPLDAQQQQRQHGSICNNTTSSIPLFLLPTPDAPEFLDRTFTAVVLKFEKTLLQKQTLTAWMATLGGGYFFIKRLSKSLQLARQQRLLALQIGNVSMARQCQLNEAYNLIYAGRFGEAKRVLKSLDDQAYAEEDHGEAQRILRQCDAARILLRRLKQLGRRLKPYSTDNPNESHTVDDFQRVRIVESV
ncbi:protein of unknown function DUF4807 containing protein [Nitzschia inconspicua]|uniref:Uncharacterized protein n=1 Tax=Nitzschia inconspicua TaxID=303405 RepID=A0A9K3L405_9STRA|nr:protein of unknown function DUF4807 containing protein [Nitzschia inconspicua]